MARRLYKTLYRHKYSISYNKPSDDKRLARSIQTWNYLSAQQQKTSYLFSSFPTTGDRASLRFFHSTSTWMEDDGLEQDARTFASENPELATGNENKIFFEDFAPGEEIPIVPLPPFDDGSGNVVAPPEMKDLADRILQLSLLEIHQLTQLFNDHFDINDSEMMFGAGFGGGGGAATGNAEEAAPVVEKTVFELKLAGFDEKSKIKIIKEIRAITGLGLKEAKELVEGAPKIVKKDIKKAEAEELKGKLEAVGAVVEIV